MGIFCGGMKHVRKEDILSELPDEDDSAMGTDVPKVGCPEMR
jgi:hypothetical protein